MPYGTVNIMTDKAQLYQGVAPSQVINAVQSASNRTGVDFAYLMEKAAAESSFNPTAKATTSSATGLYQFIDNTWLQMVEKHGAKYGLGHQAKHIVLEDNGRASVSDPVEKQRILALRNNPKIAAFMAAEFASENRAYLEDTYNGHVGKTELYLAHFLGARGASKFLNAMQQNPDQLSRDIFPKAAKANKNVFYDPANNKPRSLQEVYDFFDRKFDHAVRVAKVDPKAPVAPQPPVPTAPENPGITQDLIPFAGVMSPPAYSAATPRGFQAIDPLAVLLLAHVNDSIDAILFSDDADKGYNI